MTDEYKQHLEKKFDRIIDLQKTIGSEKKSAAGLYKDYVNALAGFPQWLAIFSGIAGVLGIFNITFLIFSFVFFLISSMILLYIRYSTSKKVSYYIRNLEDIASKASDLTYNMVIFRKGEIDQDEMICKEKEFDEKYKSMRNNVSLESTEKEDGLVDLSFWLSILGGLFLIFSILLNCKY